MATVNKKMTALADEIRELSGTTTSKSINAMTSDVDAANKEIAEQTELLTQITTALEGKASGSGGGSVETCTITVTSWQKIRGYSYTAYRDGQFLAVAYSNENTTITTLVMEDVVCGSSFMICNGTVWNGYTIEGDVRYLGESALTLSSKYLPFRAPLIAGTASVNLYNNE